ncbi:MAG: AI-2E family transporter [Myxococcales bacterium]|nr:AI-2E family transporter [Myxococcales bacterium]MCB9754673.1 AI-2E family transporter [Myxococcales bacterium]
MSGKSELSGVFARPKKRSGPLVSLAALVIVIAGLKNSGDLVLPFLVALFLTFLSAPPVLALERRRWPAWAAVSVVVVAVLTLLMGFSVLLGTTVRQFRKAVPIYRQRLLEQAETGVEWLKGLGVEVSIDDVLRGIEPGQVLDVLGSTLNGLLTALTNTTMVVLTLVFALLEVSGFPRKLRAGFSDPDSVLSQVGTIAHEIQRYLWLKTIISLLTGLTVVAWCSIMGVDFPLLWGVVAFFLNFIPMIGSIIAAIPACLVALVMDGPTSMAILGLGYIVINTFWGNMVEPKVMGDSLGLSPLVVFASLIIWEWIWGPVGMLLSVPLTMVIKIVFEQVEDLKWIAILLGSAPPREDDGGGGARRVLEHVKKRVSKVDAGPK